MKYLFYIIIVLAAVGLVYFGVLNREQPQPVSDQPVEQSTKLTREDWETKTDERGQVTVKVTSQTLSGTQWKFDVVFDTHSIELDQDLMQVAELGDDKGNIYKPIAWEGSGPGGHHREGVLAFEGINPVPSYVELKIKDVGGVPERSFKWNL